MVVFTLAFWAAAYVFFTIRSFALQHPHLEVQALLRLAMMPVGLLLCAGLFAAYVRLAEQSIWRQVGGVVLLVLAAALAYSVINYGVFYVLPGLWHYERGAVAKITEYTTTLTVWLFGLWTAVFYLAQARAGSNEAITADGSESERGSSGTDLWVRHQDRSIRVPLADILWVEAEGDYVRLHTRERSYLLRSTMAKLEQTLDPEGFIRIHRRTIIAAPLLMSLRRREGRIFAELATGTELPVGRQYLHKLRPAPSSTAAESRSGQFAGSSSSPS